MTASRPGVSHGLTLRFWRDRATRNKWVYTEERSRGVPAYVGSLYVDKEWLAGVGDPETLTVRIEVTP